MKEDFPVILYVEDEKEVQFELTRFLKRYSKHVITANNGKDGLELFKKYTPDIVISDIKMPKMSGTDMAKEIKKIVPEQTIIFTTAHSDNQYFLEAIEMQVDGYILKPVDLGILEKKIVDITKNSILQREKKLYENILDDIAQMQNNMLAVYNSKKSPVFYNKKLLTFLGINSLTEFIQQGNSLGEKFESKEECFSPKDKNIHWIDEIKKIDANQRIVSLLGTNEKESKFFLISISQRTENENIIMSFSEITSILKENKEYKHGAYTDELTQIDNRARFNILYDEMIQICEEEKRTLCMLLLDIDNFKSINDHYGHHTGDRILKAFTLLISQHIRATDYFFRWGGEEFVLLLSDISLEKSKHIAENLRMLIEKHDFGIDEQITCSFGVAIREDNDTKESLFERVDKALFKAKNNGRNRVEIG